MFLEGENFLHGDDVSFHSRNLADAGYLASSIAEAAYLNDDGNRRGDLAANGNGRDIQIRHRYHGVQTGQGVPRRIGVNCRERPIVARIHGLQHIEGFLSAYLADDYAVWTHSQRVYDQLPLLNGALAFDVGAPCFQSHDMLLMQLQFRRVLDRHNSLSIGNVGGQHVEQSGLAGSGAAGDDDIQPRLHAANQQVQHGLRQRAIEDQIVGSQSFMAKTPDRKAWAVQGQGRNNGIHTRAIGKPRIDHRGRFVDAAPNRGDDAVDDAQQMRIIPEFDPRELQKSATLDIYALVIIHEDVGNRRIP